ncbi:class I SAM-dependent methyltransferase [Ottowia thiooxydans]|uniref:class I SAM-dependent methyltransferase n=1 Tax=Ottowia thiooxydans TaxID=219182 RepID=UPI0003F5B236|nr:class I SAM-dependent methyltransferase [Ottowia thiooxydans]
MSRHDQALGIRPEKSSSRAPTLVQAPPLLVANAGTLSDQHGLHRTLVDLASARYKSGGRFSYHFARGKLGIDPLFIDLLRLGEFPAHGRFLDLGCGQAVFASWLLAARQCFEVGTWPAGWAPPPIVESLHGLELMPSDVARAQAALADEPHVRIEQGDICHADFELVDVITIFDVLHYFGPEAQDDVLRRIRAALRPGGKLVARVGDAAGGLRFSLSRWVDQAVTFVRGHGFSPMYCRSVSEWAHALESLGFEVQTIRTEGGPPFANTMLIARLPLDGAHA